MVLAIGACGLNVLVLSSDHLPDCFVYILWFKKSVYYSHFFCKKVASRFAAPVSDSKDFNLCFSAIPVS